MKELYRRAYNWAKDFLKREDGPTSVEYAVMLALIIVVCIAAITTLGKNTNSTFSFVASSILPQNTTSSSSS
jgi:pilus assembly protein Flp/PilA